MNDPLPFISVIIPVYNDAQRLATCLDALARQSYPADRIEVLVVDNGSKEPPRALVESYPSCRYAEETEPGSYAARNRGIELARGDVLAFTDADCIPAADWLAAGAAALAEHPGDGFVGGRIEVFARDARDPTAVELHDMLFGLDQQTSVERHHFAATANLWTRRETISKVGPFDAALKSGGDGDWGQRATAIGLGGRYAHQVVVRHPARRHWREIVRQVRRHVGGRFDRHRNDPYRYGSRHFWWTVWRRVWPNFARLNFARRELRARGYGLGAWLRVSGVILALQYTRLGEFGRKFLGAPSERR